MESMTGGMLIAIAVALALGIALAAVLFALMRRRGGTPAQDDRLAELAGRLAQMADSDAAAQARLDERLADFSKRIGDNLTQNTAKTAESISKLHERLAVIDAAQQNITELSGHVVGLQNILSNKQARGAFGEIQLEHLVQDLLPPSAYEFQPTLGNGKRPDCLIRLPNPPGPIVIDAKFPLESYNALAKATEDGTRLQTRRAFSADVLKHAADIAQRYIVPGETSDQAIMFLPSEAVFMELHDNLPDVIAKSHRARVRIVSPTTLWAALHTVRAILKDAQMREQAHLIQKEVAIMQDDIGRLDDRVGNLQKHLKLADKDVEEIRTSSGKVKSRAGKIEELELGEDSTAAPAADALPPGGAEIRQLQPKRG